MTVESTAISARCRGCGERAQAQDRSDREVRDLACVGRPVRLVVRQRRWRRRREWCSVRTWTETLELFCATAAMSRRAGIEACRQVGQQARAVAAIAREYGVCWWTIQHAVSEHGTPLVDDPDRVGPVEMLGVDETTFHSSRPRQGNLLRHRARRPRATPDDRHDPREHRCGPAPMVRWRRPEWITGIGVVATDLAESYRRGLSPHPGSCPPGRRSASCGASREPLLGHGPSPRPERTTRASRPQTRPALQDPQDPARRRRTPQRQRCPTVRARAPRRRPERRSPRRLAGQRRDPRRPQRHQPRRRHPAPRQDHHRVRQRPRPARLGRTLAKWRTEILAHIDTAPRTARPSA